MKAGLRSCCPWDDKDDTVNAEAVKGVVDKQFAYLDQRLMSADVLRAALQHILPEGNPLNAVHRAAEV